MGSSYKHYVASPYMTRFAKSLAEEMNIRLSTEIIKIFFNKNKVDLISISGAKENFDSYNNIADCCIEGKIEAAFLSLIDIVDRLKTSLNLNDGYKI